VSEPKGLLEAFEESRGHLRGVAYRMLGSLSEADDAVQEAWLRLNRADVSEVENLRGWLTTVVARVCLDMLRGRKSRKEEPFAGEMAEAVANHAGGTMNPEQEALLADSVGLALLVVLDRLAPAERLAFVLHDTFGVPFDEIAAILGRTPESARQLASRARRRVQGVGATADASLTEQRGVVKAFMAALHSGDFAGLIAVLDPDVVVRVDEAAGRPGAPREVRGAEKWARGAIAFTQAARGTIAFAQAVRGTEAMLVDGRAGLVIAPGGRLERVLQFTIVGGKITQVDIVGDAKRLGEMELALLE
jgi:RNA polymerase sigma-70 factor (ECF subfamily)